jgi:lipopolysaccharide export system permease protein
MKKIDWYILKKFVVTFFFCMILFTLIAVAVDTSEKTDDFVKTGLSTGQIIKQYYFGFVPFIWGLLFPLFVFIAVIFFTSRMATRSEVIAILASGASYNRFLRPYIIGGILFAGMLWYGNTYLIPHANQIKSSFQSTYMDKGGGQSRSGDCWSCYYLRIDPTTYIGIKFYDTASKTASAFFMERIKDDKVVYNLRSNSIRWDTSVSKWRLANVTERTVESMTETIRQVGDTVINIALKPEELRKDEFLKDKLVTPDLVELIEREEMRGREGLSPLKVERYRRNATPATVLLLTIIGAVIASRKTRGGSGMHLAVGIVIAAVFIISDRFSTVFATKSNFHPLLAAWLPNIVFSFVALMMYRKTPK